MTITRTITVEALAAAIAFSPILDITNSDGVRKYAAAIFAALPAEPAGAGHEPGELHRYRIECMDCGEPGNIVLSIEPQRVLAATPVGEEK